MADDRIRTHWADCWREPSHHGCCVARVERLEQKLTKCDERCQELYIHLVAVQGALVECRERIRIQQDDINACREGHGSRARELADCRKKLAAVQGADEFLKRDGLGGLGACIGSYDDEVQSLEQQLADCHENCDELSKAVDALIEERDQYDADLEECRYELANCEGDFAICDEQRNATNEAAIELREGSG